MTNKVMDFLQAYQPPSTFQNIGQINPLTGLPHNDNEAYQKLQNVTGQIANVSQRLSSIGLQDKVDAIEDPRNIVEKMLNLPEKQNFIFDIFELIRRPLMAVTSTFEDATDPYATDFNPLVSMWEGLSGQRKAYGGQVLRNMFMDGQEEDGSIDWTDFVGYAMDMAMDPMNYVTFGLTGPLEKLSKLKPETTRMIEEAGKIMREVGVMKPEAAFEAYTTLERVANVSAIAEPLVERVTASTLVTRTLSKGLGKVVKEGGRALEYGLMKADPALADAYRTFTTKTLKTMTTTGKEMSRVINKYLHLQERIEKRSSNILLEYDTEALAEVNKVLSMDQINKMASKIDLTNERTVSNTAQMLAKELSPILNVDEDILSRDLIDAILNRGKDGKALDVLQQQISNHVNANAMALFEYQNMERAPMTFEQAIDWIHKTKIKNLPYNTATEQFWKSRLGDDFQEYIEVTTQAGQGILKFTDRFWKDGPWALKRYGPMGSVEDGLNFLRKGLEGVRENVSGSTNGTRLVDSIEALLNGTLKKEDWFAEYGDLYRATFFDKFKIGSRSALPKVGDVVAELTKQNNPLGQSLTELLKNEGALKESISATAKFLNSGTLTALTQQKGAVNKQLAEFLKNNADWASKQAMVEKLGLSPADVDLFNAMIKDSPDNLGYAISHFANKYPAMLRMMPPELKVIFSDVGEIDLLTGKSLIPPSSLFKDKMTVGHFYTAKQLEDFQKMQANPMIQNVTNIFKNKMEDMQRLLGKNLYNDAETFIVNGMKGYAPHVSVQKLVAQLEGLTPEQAKEKADAILEEMLKQTENQEARSFFVFGKTKSMSERMYDMSSMEANNIRAAYMRESIQGTAWFQELPDDMKDLAIEYFGKDTFSQQARTSLIDMMTTGAHDLTYNKRNYELLAAMTFGNPYGEESFYRAVDKATALPKNFIQLTDDQAMRNVVKTLDQVSQWVPDNSEYIKELRKMTTSALAKGSDKVLIMEKHLYKALMNQKDPIDFYTFLDATNNMFKALKVTSPGFNIKNITGNTFNMWAAGMPLKDIPKYWISSFKMYRQFEAINEKVIASSSSALTPEELDIYNIVTNFKINGFFERENIMKMNDLGLLEEIKNQGTNKVVNAFDKSLMGKMMDANLSANMFVDNISRMSLYRYAMDNPDILMNHGLSEGVDGAMDLMRLALFDPNDLSFFERDVMKRIIPFYTWSRQNLVFQAKNMVRDAQPYYKLWKTFDALWSGVGIDSSELQDYERDNFFVPVPWITKDGNYTALKLSLPAADIFDMLTPMDAMHRVVSATTPLIKAPFEKVMGVESFTGQPIERYEGEMSKKIPFASKKTEWHLSQLGLDVPISVLGGGFRVGVEVAKGANVDLEEVYAALGDDNLARGISQATTVSTIPRSVTSNKMYQQYEKLDRLNALLKKQQDAGKTVPTVAELTAGNPVNQLQKKNKQLEDLLKQVKSRSSRR